MAPDDLHEQIIKYLTDAHSIEEQALAQMRAAPDLAGNPAIAAHFAAHLAETERHEQLVRARLDALGASPSTVKDVAGAVSGKGFVLFARSQPDTPGKLLTHGVSYEHMELAAYELLTRAAELAGDAETAELARAIAAEERAMADRLEGCYDLALEASLDAHFRDDPAQLLDKYLTDAHALEGQSITLLDKGPKLAGTSLLAAIYEEHKVESEDQLHRIEELLDSRGSSPSKLKDAALRLGALNWGGFFGAQPDTPAKLAGFAYAVEHLEVAAYELLRRVAARAGDGKVEHAAAEILAQERAAAQRIQEQFGTALDASLAQRGLTADPAMIDDRR